MKFHSLLASLLLSIALVENSHINAEIQQVTIKWTTLLCSTQQCLALLDKELRKVPGIADFTINQGAGQAVIDWRPNMPFNFQDVNVPLRLVGLSVRDIHVKVRGTLSHDSKTVTITSIGDNTRFQLLNPVVTNPGQQAAIYNLGARQLSPELHQKLVEGETQGMIATVQGPIFMPGRSSAMQLVVGNVSFSKPKPEEPGKKGSGL